MEEKMSSLHDPFDLLKPETSQDNVIPFLPKHSIEAMIDKALATPQLKADSRVFRKPKNWTLLGGTMIAACLMILIFSVFSGGQPPTEATSGASLAMNKLNYGPSNEDAYNEFNDMIMLATLESY
jgi:hypothetical protein